MPDTPHVWLRAEQKVDEQRCALTPDVAARLVEAGFKVSVEQCSQRVFNEREFENAGCEIVPHDSWQSAPVQAWILGLKELSAGDFALRHKHIHFAHIYKEQTGWQQMLRRFKSGGGRLYDLEYLVDENGARVAAFGYWAGFAGAALALGTWAGQQLGRKPVLDTVQAWPNKGDLLDALIRDTRAAMDAAGRVPEVLVMGALGRSGQGAVECIESCGCRLLAWDIEQTRSGGPFAEILAADVFVNCVFVSRPIQPFLTSELLETEDRKLSVICDVSCDPYGELNPLPIYSECTSFETPVERLRPATANSPALDLISIDHLPSMLPLEASENFVAQLEPYLLQLANAADGQGDVWSRAQALFEEKLKLL